VCTGDLREGAGRSDTVLRASIGGKILIFRLLKATGRLI